MPVRFLHPSRADVLSNFIDNSMSGTVEGRTMSHMGLSNPLVPLSMAGFALMFFLPGLVGGQGLLPGAPTRNPGDTLKEYSGVRANNESLRQVYFHDQTIAVVEIGPGKELLNCELVEVFDNVTLALQKESFVAIAKPIEISFKEIQDLMQNCQLLTPPEGADKATPPKTEESVRSQDQPRGPLSLFSGIMPGTKWCGTGDIANTYFDLGEMNSIDKCCRTHDLCPAKVRAFTSRYNLTNYSLYTKSHCSCDSTFYDCLKATDNPTANLMGNVYFNIVRVPCVEDVGCEGETCERQRRFRTIRKRY